jgi:predicted GNAT family acetyltransferase
MAEVALKLNEKNHGAFHALEGSEELGEMVISISGKELTVFHTEVKPEEEGKGVAKQLLDAMVDHARKNELKVIPLCPYVYVQFRRHPKDYADIWKKAD